MSDEYVVLGTAQDEGWLERRLDYVTGSEMAIVMGVAPTWYNTTREDLVREKATRRPKEWEPSRRMWWGSASEVANIRILGRLAGARVRPTNVMVAAPEARISATLDGFIKPPAFPDRAEYPGNTTNDAAFARFVGDLTRCRGVGIVEAKQSDGWPKQIQAWEVGVPEHYWVQVQAALYVLGLEWGVIFDRLGVADCRAHVVRADEFFHAEMVDAVAEFWKEVEREQG